MLEIRPCPALLVACMVLVVAKVATGKGSSLADVASRVPSEIAGLRVAGEDGVYEGEGIFEYLNGGGEVYLAYNMRGCLAREYTGPAGSFTVDLFDMGSAADAFGVFTYDQDGETVEVGQDALLRPGWLSFWKGRFFVSVTADSDDEAAQVAILALGRAAASAIREEGVPPALLRRLPTEGLLPRSVRYLHHPVIMRCHLDVGEADAFDLEGDTEAVLARYWRDQETATLVLVRYRDDASSSAARERAGSSLLASWPGEAVQQGTRGGWLALGVSGKHLVLVAEASGPDVARALLAELLDAGQT